MTSPLPLFLGNLFPLVNDGFHAVCPDAPSRVGIYLLNFRSVGCIYTDRDVSAMWVPSNSGWYSLWGVVAQAISAQVFNQLLVTQWRQWPWYKRTRRYEKVCHTGPTNPLNSSCILYYHVLYMPQLYLSVLHIHNNHLCPISHPQSPPRRCASLGLWNQVLRKPWWSWVAHPYSFIFVCCHNQ